MHRRDPASAPSPAREDLDTPATKTLSLEDIAAGEHPHAASESSVSTNHRTVSGLHSARLVSVNGRRATIQLRGETLPVDANIATDVEDALVALALKHGDRVLVEPGDDDCLEIVGVLQTRVPNAAHIAADEIHLEAAKVLVLKAGRAAIKLHKDGQVELLGTKINAVSRGLFKIVGRVLRLN